MTAENLRQTLCFPIDIKDGLKQRPLHMQLMKGDKKANRVIVALTDGDKNVDLSGATATGGFIRPPDEAEIPLPGEVDGNHAIVTLVDECYVQEGYCKINVKLTVGETERTILALTGHVLSKGSGAYVDIGNVVPNIDDIVAQYAEMKRVTEETRTAGAAAASGASAANTAAGTANTAAQRAENAAKAIEGMTVSAVSGTEPGAEVTDQNGAKHIAFTLPKGDKGDKGDQGPPGQDGTGSGTVTGVKVGNQTYAPAGDGVVELPAPDTTLKEAGKAADAKATGDAFTQFNQAKANQTGWTAVKNVVTDENGNLVTEDKPMIPNVPSALPNPYPLMINGKSYDGSKAVEMSVSGLPDGGEAGQVLTKASAEGQDVEWADVLAGMNLELLWENDAPSSSFGQGDVNISPPDSTNMLLVELHPSAHVFVRFGQEAYAGTISWYNNGFVLMSRQFIAYRDKIGFNDAYISIASTQMNMDNSRIIPLRIYAVKGVSV